jgi:hypothetical protein
VKEDPRWILQCETDDLYAGALPLEELDIKTFYEFQHLSEGKKITYLGFSLL